MDNPDAVEVMELDPAQAEARQREGVMYWFDRCMAAEAERDELRALVEVEREAERIQRTKAGYQFDRARALEAAAKGARDTLDRALGAERA